MRRLLASLLALVWLCSPALADYTATQGAGTTFWAQTITAKQMPTFGIGDANAASIIYAPGSTTAGQSGFLMLCRTLTAAPTDTTAQSNVPSCTTAGELRVNIGASAAVAATQSGTWTVQPGNTANTTPWLATVAQGGNSAVVKAGNTAGTTDVALVVSDPNVLASLNGATPAGTNRTGFVTLQTDTTGGATSFHALSAGTNNSTSVKGSAGTVYSITIVQTTTTLGDFRFYDSASAPTCSSATGVIANYAVQSNATSPGFHLTFPYGKAFANGIGFCLTGAVADNDNTNFVTGAQINIEWK